MSAGRENRASAQAKLGIHDESRGGQTDTSRNYGYTEWDLVETFARECAGSLGGNT